MANRRDKGGKPVGEAGTTPKSSIPAILSAHGGKLAAPRSAIEIASPAKPATPKIATPPIDVTATPVTAPAIEAATAVPEAIATAASEPAKVPAAKARAPRAAALKPAVAAPAPKAAELAPAPVPAAPTAPVEAAKDVAKPVVEAVEAAAGVATSVVEAAKPASDLAEPMVEAATAATEIAETVIDEAATATKPVADAAAAAFPAAAPAAPTASKDYWTMATVYETPKAMTDINERAKSAFEKSGKMVEEFNEFAKGNVEALVESGKIAAKGFESMGQDAADYGRRSFETLTTTMKSLASVKSPTEFFKLQSDYVRTAFDSAVAEASKSTEAMLKLAGDAAQPLSNRMAVAAEKAKIAA